jgi:hypothetical protein
MFEGQPRVDIEPAAQSLFPLNDQPAALSETNKA